MVAETIANRLPVDTELLNKAMTAIIKHHNGTVSKSALLGGDLPVHVQFTLARVPEKTSSRPIRIAIPHPLHKVLNPEESDVGLEDAEVCLFVKDESKQWVKELLEKFPNEMGSIKKVLTLTSLRKKFTQYKDRRELLKSYDIFLADDRILPMLGKALGKNFFQEKKQPVPIKLTRKEALPFTIKKCLRSSFMWISPGTCVSVKAGNTAMPLEHLVANATAIVENAAAHIPRKWSNISAINVKTSQSVALPIYNKTREELEEIAKIANVASCTEKKRAREEEEEEAERKTVGEAKKKQKKAVAAKSPLVKALKKAQKKNISMSKTDAIDVEISKETKERPDSVEGKAAEVSIKSAKRKKIKAIDNKEVIPKSNKKQKESKDFISSKKFKGSKKGFVYKMGERGLGYYVDIKPVPDKKALAALAKMSNGGNKRRSISKTRKSGRKGYKSI
jgi:ribosome biogenesis protein UTP30